MKFLQRLIPEFLNKIDHRLLINKPVIWRTKAHYLIFYAAIIVAIVFSFGLFYPHTVYEETYGNPRDRDELAIITTLIMSIVVIIFWSTRLYQFKTKISKWKHFIYTFGIYFFCLFILFSSLSCFHYGSFFNRSNLLNDFSDSHSTLEDNNFFIPFYFPHFQDSVIEDLDSYIEEAQELSHSILTDKPNTTVEYYFAGNEEYSKWPIEFFEQLNLIKQYLKELNSVVIKEEDYPWAFEYKVAKADSDSIKSLTKKALFSALDPPLRNFLTEIGIDEDGFESKIYGIGKSSFSKDQIEEVINLKAKVDGEEVDTYRTSFWLDNNDIASAFLFRYEHYVRLRNFVYNLEDKQYDSYQLYLRNLDTLEQIQFYIDEHLIQEYEIAALASFDNINDDHSFSKADFPNYVSQSQSHSWNRRFNTRNFLLDQFENTDNTDTSRAELLTAFFEELDSTQIQSYKEYIQFSRILYNELETNKALPLFNSETGLSDYAYQKCYTYFTLKGEDIDKVDKVMFFNYFDSDVYSIKLSPRYYPLIIQKRFFDKWYNDDAQNEAKLNSLMSKNNLIRTPHAEDADYAYHPDRIFDRLFMFHAFQKTDRVRSDAFDMGMFLGFFIANILLSFFFAIFIFYLSSVPRNTILLSLFLLGIIYIILTALSVSFFLVGIVSIILYLLLTVALAIIFYKPKYQIKNIKLITTSYIFYAITVHFFMFERLNDDVIFGVSSSWVLFILLSMTFFMLFIYSFFFIRYIQLPVKG